jgi:peroxiredoxin
MAQSKKSLLEKRFTVLSILVLIFAASWIWLTRVQAGGTSLSDTAAPRQGFLAPDFSIESSNGETISIGAQEGKVLLVNFWTSWCPPCRAEMPAIQRVYQEYQDDGLVVLAINATNQDNIADVISFIAENGLSFPILFDRDGEISRKYNLYSLPTSYFIDQDGIIRDVVIGGPMAEALLRTRIEDLLEGSH